MGYNEGILIDETHPELPFKEGYVDYVESWKRPQTPTSWIKNSCVWYSQITTQKLGIKKFSDFLQKFNYGNHNTSGDVGENNGLTESWLGSSLQISPQEQVTFLQKLLDNKLPVSVKGVATGFGL
jgi:beta-lactamase class D